MPTTKSEESEEQHASQACGCAHTHTPWFDEYTLCLAHRTARLKKGAATIVRYLVA